MMWEKKTFNWQRGRRSAATDTLLVSKDIENATQLPRNRHAMFMPCSRCEMGLMCKIASHISYHYCCCRAILICVVWAVSASHFKSFNHFQHSHFKIGWNCPSNLSHTFSHLLYSIATWKRELLRTLTHWGSIHSVAPKSSKIGGTRFLYCSIKWGNETSEEISFIIIFSNLSAYLLLTEAAKDPGSSKTGTMTCKMTLCHVECSQ